MSKVLLVNPSRRRKRRGRKAKARSRRRRRARPVGRTITVKRVRRTGRGRRRRSRAYGRPIKVRRIRRNPSGLRGILNDQIMPAAVGAGGALALDVAMGYAAPYIPAMLATGPVRHVTKAVVAIGLGFAANMVGVKGSVAKQATLGALTVVLHDAAREQLATFAPGLALGEFVSGLGFANAGAPAGIALPGPDGMSGFGEYVSGASDYIASDSGAYTN